MSKVTKLIQGQRNATSDNKHQISLESQIKVSPFIFRNFYSFDDLNDVPLYESIF